MDYLDAVAKKETEFNGLYKRMDGDKDLRYLNPYIMKDLHGQRIHNVINITLNDPAVFAIHIESSLSATKQQTIVESEDKKLDAAFIEEFQQAVLEAANARLRNAHRSDLNPFFDQHLCQRGSVAARCLMQLKGDVLAANIVPWDARYLTYEVAEDGLLWAAYRTKKTKAMIEREYQINITTDDADCLDVWDREHNEVFLGKERVRDERHPYGYVPVAFQRVPLGSLLQDSDAFEHQGESIFFLIRDLIPEINRLASIAQTLNMKKTLQAILWKSKEGTRATPPDYDKVTGIGAITATDAEGGAEPVHLEDLARAALMLQQMIEQRLQRGSLSAIDYGTLEFPLSAVALVEIGEGRDQVFLPRLQAKALLNQRLAEMFTQQIIQMGISVKIGREGHEKQWDIGKLEGEYETKYKYFVKSPKLDIARYSMASHAERWLDDNTIREEILQLEDPESVKQKKYYDLAEKISPLVMRRRIIKALVEMDEDSEAQYMAAELGISLEQLLSGAVPEIPEQKAQKAEPMLPMFGGRQGSGQKAAELQGTPRQEEGR